MLGRCAQGPEAVGSERRFRGPNIVAGEVDVLPTERREVGEELVRGLTRTTRASAAWHGRNIHPQLEALSRRLKVSKCWPPALADQWDVNLALDGIGSVALTC